MNRAFQQRDEAVALHLRGNRLSGGLRRVFQAVDQQRGLAFHVHRQIEHATTEIAMEQIGNDRHDQAGGGRNQRLTDAARQWQGWGTALKPALEPITVARKPLVGTVAANVLQHGTGALNIDGCRVTGEGNKTFNRDAGERPRDQYRTGTTVGAAMPTDAGRWPANLIHDGSEPADLLGEAARFFYCAKASKRDRDEGLEHMEAVNRPNGNKWTDQDYRVLNGERSEGREAGPRKNIHPTVKPTELMRYLCRLVTPPGGTVLDPFMGSGSTGKAAMREGFRFIGCEMSPEYLEIARARIESAMKVL